MRLQSQVSSLTQQEAKWAAALWTPVAGHNDRTIARARAHARTQARTLFHLQLPLESQSLKDGENHFLLQGQTDGTDNSNNNTVRLQTAPALQKMQQLSLTI